MILAIRKRANSSLVRFQEMLIPQLYSQANLIVKKKNKQIKCNKTY